MRSGRAAGLRGRGLEWTVAPGGHGPCDEAARCSPSAFRTVCAMVFASRSRSRSVKRRVAVAGERVRGVAAPVALEALAGAVVRPAVGLDDEPLGGEEEVDLVLVDVLVDQRGREAVVAADLQEEAFEVALGEPGAGFELVERRSEPRGTVCPGCATAIARQGGVVGERLDLDLVEEPFEVTARQDRGEVEDGAGGRGHGDAVARGDFVERQGARAMDPEAGPRSAAPRHRHVRATRRVRADAPQRTRRPVAEHRARTAREVHGPRRDARVARGSQRFARAFATRPSRRC